MNTKKSFITKKSLGQNFLVNQGVVKKIIAAAEIKPGERVVEVGPGTGVLTRALVEAGAKVTAIEKDRRLIRPLRQKFPQAEIIEADILKFDPFDYGLVASRYKLVGNIPYYITSHFTRAIFEKWPRPKLVVLTVQKEVARRIMACPPQMNLLALSVQIFSEPEIISYVSKGSFRPIPKVDSAIVKLIPKDKIKNQKEILDLAKKGFSSKRKQLAGNLVEFGPVDHIKNILKRAKIREDARAENLSIPEWQKIAEFLGK